ncbi:MAG: hypothetical protein U9R20_02530, partial [Thermodesulfobacteriota bacterium]|nr:hypothetical protein [Thermodesulfobacteriota bacterium]
MSGKILEAFKEKKSFNILELMLRIQVGKDRLKKTLDILVNNGKLKIEEKCFPYPDDSPICRGLNSRSSISGFNG